MNALAGSESFPSGRTLEEVMAERIAAHAATQFPDRGGRVVGLDSSPARPAPVGNSRERIRVFEAAAAVYEKTSRDVVVKRLRVSNAETFWRDAMDEYAVAAQVNAEARERFRKACAGIDPETGLRIP